MDKGINLHKELAMGHKPAKREATSTAPSPSGPKFACGGLVKGNKKTMGKKSKK